VILFIELIEDEFVEGNFDKKLLNFLGSLNFSGDTLRTFLKFPGLG
jgi:hypothetical protein